MLQMTDCVCVLLANTYAAETWTSLYMYINFTLEMGYIKLLPVSNILDQQSKTYHKATRHEKDGISPFLLLGRVAA